MSKAALIFIALAIFAQSHALVFMYAANWHQDKARAIYDGIARGDYRVNARYASPPWYVRYTRWLHRTWDRIKDIR
jgi:hypothetical protein